MSARAPGLVTPVDWSEEDRQQLRDLWAEGMSVSQIGVVMGRTRNSIVGKAHRLNLSPRPSPIIRAGQKRAPLRPGDGS